MIEIKQGDTKTLVCTYEPAVGSRDITHITIRSSVYSRTGVFVGDLEVRKSDPLNGGFELTTANSKDWPVGVHDMDIRYEHDGLSIATETVQISVRKAITRAA